jgi:hypothetical protein
MDQISQNTCVLFCRSDVRHGLRDGICDHDWFSDQTDAILTGLFLFCPIAALILAWPTLKLVRRDKQDKLRKQMNLPDRNQLSPKDRKEIKDQIWIIVILLVVAVAWLASLSLYPYVRMFTSWLVPEPQPPTPSSMFLHMTVKMAGGVTLLMWPMWINMIVVLRLCYKRRKENRQADVITCEPNTG